MTFDDFVAAQKAAAIAIGKKALIDWLAGAAMQVAFFQTRLGLALLNPFLGIAAIVVEKVLTVLVTYTEFGAFFLYIDTRVHAQGEAYSKAAIKYREAMEKGTQEEKDAATKALIDSFRPLARFTA